MPREVTVVVPVFNECRNIGAVVAESRKHAARVVVVDDGSTDNSADIARAYGAIVLTQHNSGAGGATRTGIDFAVTNYPDTFAVVLIDGDGQHNPEDIDRLVNKINSGFDLAIGTRELNLRDTPLLRWIGNRTLGAIRNFGNSCRIRDAECGFRAFSRKALSQIEIDTTNFGFCEEMAIKARGLRLEIAEVTIATVYGEEQHKYPVWKKAVDCVGIAVSIIKFRWLYEWRPEIEARLGRKRK